MLRNFYTVWDMTKLKLGFAPLVGGAYTKPAPTADSSPPTPISSWNGEFTLTEIIVPIDYGIIIGLSAGGLLTITVLSLTLYFAFIARDKLGSTTSAVDNNSSGVTVQ